jgi:hypothetical protein
MATRPFCSHTARGLSPRASRCSIAGRICLFLTPVLSFAALAHAQLQQPFVYTTGGAIATRNDATGVLAPTSASPLTVLGVPAVLDAKGRFLFTAGNNSIHMYQVDSVTGSYTEVPGSPFASANTNSPTLIATEPTGAYLAVVNSIGLNPGESSVESFQINAAAGALVPVSGSFLELVSAPIGSAANPALGTFYVYLGPNPSSSNPFYLQDGDLLTYTIHPLTGLLGNQTGSAGSTNRGRSLIAAHPRLTRRVHRCICHSAFYFGFAFVSRMGRMARLDLRYWSPCIAVENRLRHGGAPDFHPSPVRGGRLRRRIDNHAYSPKNFYRNAERHFRSGHHADSHQRFR